MNARRKKAKTPILFAAGSFLALVILMMTTSPVKNIIYAIVFFGILTIFFYSLGYLLIYLQAGQVTPRSRYRIVTVCLVLLTLFMFRSANSLSWIDALIMVLISFGLIFYISKRA